MINEYILAEYVYLPVPDVAYTTYVAHLCRVLAVGPTAWMNSLRPRDPSRRTAMMWRAAEWKAQSQCHTQTNT